MIHLFVTLKGQTIGRFSFTQQDEIRWTDRVVILAGTMANGTFTLTTE